MINYRFQKILRAHHYVDKKIDLPGWFIIYNAWLEKDKDKNKSLVL